ncbi:MAG: DUF4838 domain-containing protein [Victivallaceae bacterium]|nr:DUF4838 domain-containing protein [Victivallaceae bacterium]
MRKIAICTLFVCSTAVMGLTLVRDGRAEAKIVISNQANHLEIIPAQTLREYVKKRTGTTLEIIDEKSVVSGSGALILVGSGTHTRQLGIDVNSLKRDGYFIKTQGRYLILAGRDKEAPCRKSAMSKMVNNVWGTLNAVHRFLEDYCEIRWYMPGEYGEVVPRKPDLIIPDGINRQETPYFWWAQGSYCYGVLCQGEKWSRRNMFRTGLLMAPLAGHSWSIMVPAEKYGREHPEYFRMGTNGKRTAHDNMLCTSNPDVLRIAIQNISKLFDQGYELVTLGQSDGYYRCQCKKCEALDEYRDQNGIGCPVKDKPCERIHQFHYQIARALAESYPSCYCLDMAYGPTLYPSGKIKFWGKNVIVSVAPPRPELLKAWDKKAEGLAMWIYWWRSPGEFSNFLPIYSPYKVASLMREYIKSGVIGVQFCYGGENFGNEGPSYYILGRLMRDANVDIQKELAEYYRRYYETAAVPMQKYFETLYPLMDTAADVKSVQDEGEAEFNIRLFGAYSPAELSKCKTYLEQAMAATADKKIKRRIELSGYNLEYTILSAKAFRKYTEYQSKQDANRLAALETAVKSRNQYVSSFFTPSALEKQQGLPKPFGITGEKTALYGRHNQLTIPFKIDFAALKTTNRSLEVQKSFADRAVEAPVLDGKLNDACWQNAEELFFVENTSLRLPQAPTTAKIAYDSGNVYFAFKCMEPDISKMKLPLRNHDDEIYTQECVEIFIKPTPQAREYIHFIASPTPGSVTRFESNGSAWQKEKPDYSPKWRAASYIDPVTECWTMEIAIPASALGLEQIRKSAAMRIGLYRERHIKTAEFSAWSATLSQMFAVPDKFGWVRFR